MGVAELLAGDAADLVERLLDLRFQVLRILLAVGVIERADVGGDGEAGRHRQAQIGHLGQPRALAAEQVAHAGLALGAAVAERIDPLVLCGGFGGRRFLGCRFFGRGLFGGSLLRRAPAGFCLLLRLLRRLLGAGARGRAFSRFAFRHRTLCRGSGKFGWVSGLYKHCRTRQRKPGFPRMRLYALRARSG